MNLFSDTKFYKFVPRIIFVFLAFFVGYEIYSKMIVSMNTISYDDAFHGLKGLLIAEDLHNGDWLSVLYDSYRQVYYPPLYSLLLGITFFFFPPSITLTGLFSLVFFILLAIVIYFTSLEMDDSNGDWIAIIASGLLLTSGALSEFASRPMLEIPGLFALALTTLFYFRLTESPKSLRLNFLLGLGIVITYFIKSNYGILLMIVVAIVLLIDVEFRPRRLLNRQNFYLALPIILSFVIWFAYPPKLISTWSAMVNVPWGVKDTFSAAGFLYYPRALVKISGSTWLFLILILGFVISLRFFRNRKIRFLFLLIVLQLLIGQFHHTKVVRHIFPVLPALFLIAGYIFVKWWNRKLFGNRILDYWLPRIVTLAVLLYSFTLFSNSVIPLGTKVDNGFLDKVSALLLENESTLIISTIEIKGIYAPSLDWHLITDYHALDASHSGIAMNLVWDEKAVGLIGRLNTFPQLQRLLIPVFTRADEPGISRTLCLGQPLNASYSQNQIELRNYLQSMREKWDFDNVVVITSIRPDIVYPIEFIAPVLEDMGFRSSSTNEFSDIKNRVDHYIR